MSITGGTVDLISFIAVAILCLTGCWIAIRIYCREKSWGSRAILLGLLLVFTDGLGRFASIAWLSYLDPSAVPSFAPKLFATLSLVSSLGLVAIAFGLLVLAKSNRPFL